MQNDFLNPRMPAEWEEHEATWIAWPHEESDFPGKLQTISWVYAEIVRILARSERVEILCKDELIKEIAETCIQSHSVPGEKLNYRLHTVATDRSWLRDSLPTMVYSNNKRIWVKWKFNAWAKYDNYLVDEHVPDKIAEISSCDLVSAQRPDNQQALVLEGGAIEIDGQGTLIVTEECLLSEIQQRNAGLSKADYEEAFLKYLGIRKTIWLEAGIHGDDTHGHIDDITRFVAPGVVVTAYDQNTKSVNFKILDRNYQQLLKEKDAEGRNLKVIKLPMPSDIYFEGQILPASYANFYISNNTVLVPTFNDKNDRLALNILSEVFPNKEVVGIHAVDLVLGYGTLHCLTQQQPK